MEIHLTIFVLQIQASSFKDWLNWQFASTIHMLVVGLGHTRCASNELLRTVT